VCPSLRWADHTPSYEEQVPADQRKALFERLAAADSGVPDADAASQRAESSAFMHRGVGELA
jgi:hypothetical protein